MGRFAGCDAREVRDEDTAGLGLPPGIDDRTAALSDMVMIPMPGFLIDGLTDGAQHVEAAKGFVLYEVEAEPHQAADGGGRRIEDIHFELIDDVPKPACI